MTRKKYILNFTVDGNIIPVPFDVYIGGQDASEIGVVTPWSQTFSRTIITASMSNMDSSHWEGIGTIDFGSPVINYSVTVNPHTLSLTQTEILNSNGEVVGLTFEYYSSTDTASKTFTITVNANMDPEYYLSTIEDRLNWLKTNKTA